MFRVTWRTTWMAVPAMRAFAVVSSVVVVVAISTMSVDVARAQEAPVTTPAPPPPPAPPAPVPNRDSVSPGAAFALSFGGTLASLAIGAAGIAGGNAIGGFGALGALIMPSTGRWYAHASAVGGLIVRFAGLGLIVSGVERAIDDDTAGGRRYLYLGGVTFLVGALYDIVRAPLDADAYNARPTVLPTIQRAGSGFAMGMAMQF